MKTKMYTQKVNTKFTIGGFNSLLMMVLIFISCAMQGQNRPRMPWGGSDPNRTGEVDWFGGWKGTVIQANNDNSNDPEENIYFRVGGSNDWKWFYDPQMVITPERIFLTRNVQIDRNLDISGRISSSSFISANGDLFSQSGNIYALNGTVTGRAVVANQYISSSGYITATGDLLSQSGNISALNGTVTGKALVANQYISTSGYITANGDLLSQSGNISALNGSLTGKTLVASQYISTNGIISANGSVASESGNLISKVGNIYALQGNLFSKKGNLYTELGDLSSLKGNVYTTEGNVFSKKGNLYTELGDLSSLKGNVYTSEGNLFSKNGNIFTDNGYIKASKGVQTTGYLYAAGKVFLGGNFDASGTAGDPSTYYTSNAILNKYSVFVQKGVLSEDYALAPQEVWADYVFTKEHVIKPLKEVDNYIKENGNLPNIPSASQIAKDGYNLHEMNVKFLEKIEELTLYTIAQQKSIDEQHLAIVRLEQQVQELLHVAKK